MSDAEAQLVTTYLEAVWNEADPNAFEALTSPDFAYHLAGQPPRDGAATLEFLRDLRIAFPDWHVEIRNVVASEGSVAIRWSGSATHEGPFHGIEPTGRRIEVSGISLYTIENGRIAAEWEQMDSLGLLHQLGGL